MARGSFDIVLQMFPEQSQRSTPLTVMQMSLYFLVANRHVELNLHSLVGNTSLWRGLVIEGATSRDWDPLSRRRYTLLWRNNGMPDHYRQLLLLLWLHPDPCGRDWMVLELSSLFTKTTTAKINRVMWKSLDSKSIEMENTSNPEIPYNVSTHLQYW